MRRNQARKINHANIAVEKATMLKITFSRTVGDKIGYISSACQSKSKAKKTLNFVYKASKFDNSIFSIIDKSHGCYPRWKYKLTVLYQHVTRMHPTFYSRHPFHKQEP